MGMSSKMAVEQGIAAKIIIFKQKTSLWENKV